MVHTYHSVIQSVFANGCAAVTAILRGIFPSTSVFLHKIPCKVILMTSLHESESWAGKQTGGEGDGGGGAV